MTLNFAIRLNKTNYEYIMKKRRRTAKGLETANDVVTRLMGAFRDMEAQMKIQPPYFIVNKAN